MSPKWRKRTDGTPAQIGQTIKIEKKQPFRLPARYGMDANDRVSGVKERTLIQPLPRSEQHVLAGSAQSDPYYFIAKRPGGDPSDVFLSGSFKTQAEAEAGAKDYNRSGLYQYEIFDRRVKSQVSYWCPDCGKEFSGADGKTRCPQCQSLNLERSLGNNRWIKADADEIGAAHLIHTRGDGPLPLEKAYLDGKISKEDYEAKRQDRERAEEILRHKDVAELEQLAKTEKDPKLKRHYMMLAANEAYVKGKISETTWRGKLNSADRVAAPGSDEVLRNIEQRSLAQGRPTEESKRYNGWSNWDTWETKLILDNTQETSRWEEAWGKNWHQKIKAGKFEPEKAELVVSKYLVPVARGKRKWANADVTPDPQIDPKKVNKAEIVHSIISDYEEELAYQEKHKGET